MDFSTEYSYPIDDFFQDLKITNLNLTKFIMKLEVLIGNTYLTFKLFKTQIPRRNFKRKVCIRICV